MIELKDVVNSIPKKHKKTRWVVIGIVIFVVGILTLAAVITSWDTISNKIWPPTYSLSDTELKEQTLEIRTEIIIFSDEREKNQPQIDFNNWKTSTDLYLNYSKETENQWDLRFASKVQFLYGEFQKRNMRLDEMTEMLIESPGGSTSWMKTIAIELGTLAYQLRS